MSSLSSRPVLTCSKRKERGAKILMGIVGRKDVHVMLDQDSATRGQHSYKFMEI